MRSFLVRALVPSPALAVAGAAFLARLEPLGNADLIWHLALGRFIVHNRYIPDLNSFYYTPAAGPGYDYSWLAQVLYYLAYLTAGANGLVILNALLAAGIVFALYKMLERGSRNILLNLAMVVLAHLAISPYMSGRTAAFSVLFLASMLVLLSFFYAGRRRVLWAIPFMTVFWANLHSGVFLAPAILVVFVVFSPGRRHALLICLAATLAALFANPYTWRIYAMPYAVVRSLSMMRNLTEWVAPSGWMMLYFALLTAVVFHSLALSKPGPAELILLALALVGAAIAERNVALYAVVALWVVGREFGSVAASVRRRWPFRRFEVSISGVGGWVWPLLLPSAMLLAGRPSHAPLRNPLRLSRYPVSAVGWVKEHLPEGNIFVREEWSGYLLWEMPDRRLFFDAKGGFSPEAMCDHNELVAPGPKWREVMSKYDISTVIVPGSSPLAVVLSDAIDWRRAWTDSLACVYVRTARPKGCGVPP